MMVQTICQAAGQPQVNQLWVAQGSMVPNHCTPGGMVKHWGYGGGPSEAVRSFSSLRYVLKTPSVLE